MQGIKKGWSRSWSIYRLLGETTAKGINRMPYSVSPLVSTVKYDLAQRLDALFIDRAANAGVPAYFIECRLDEETVRRSSSRGRRALMRSPPRLPKSMSACEENFIRFPKSQRGSVLRSKPSTGSCRAWIDWKKYFEGRDRAAFPVRERDGCFFRKPGIGRASKCRRLSRAL
jgi:hypothetical protein